MTIPFFDLRAQTRSIRAELDAAISGVINSGEFVLGSSSVAFEKAFASYCNAQYGVGVGNGTDALEVALRALDIGPGKRVAMPAMTFFATYEAVVNVGATPVLVDVDERTLTIDTQLLAEAAVDGLDAVVVVHLYGIPVDIDSVKRAAPGTLIVEDAAQAHGARVKGSRVGGLGDAAAFSFYPSKNLGALGDGGFVATNDADVAERARVLRNHGETAKYTHTIVGRNSRLDAIQAAVLSVKLPRLDTWNEQRRGIATVYASYLGGTVRMLLPSSDTAPVWHLFPVAVEQPEAFMERLASEGIGSARHYPRPLHLHEAVKTGGSFPEAEAWAEQTVSLPMFPEMTIEDAERVSEVVLRSV